MVVIAATLGTIFGYRRRKRKQKRRRKLRGANIRTDTDTRNTQEMFPLMPRGNGKCFIYKQLKKPKPRRVLHCDKTRWSFENTFSNVLKCLKCPECISPNPPPSWSPHQFPCRETKSVMLDPEADSQSQRYIVETVVEFLFLKTPNSTMMISLITSKKSWSFISRVLLFSLLCIQYVLISETKDSFLHSLFSSFPYSRFGSSH